MTGARPFSLRQARSGDAEAINGLYRAVTGRKRTQDEYRWEWEQSPEAPSERWVILEEASGRIVGHFGLIPLAFTCRGRQLLAGKTENTMVDPVFRSRFYYIPHEKKAFQDAQDRFQLFFTTAGRGAPGLIRKRLGYREIGKWRTYILYASPGYVKTRMLQGKAFQGRVVVESPMSILCHGLVLLRRLMLTRGEGLRPTQLEFTEDVLDAIDHFWTRNRSSFGCTPERNADFVRWRFHRNPHHSYALYGFYDGDRLKGYLIARGGEIAVGKRRFRKLVIEDLVASGNRDDLCAGMLKGMNAEFRRNDLVSMRVLLPAGDPDPLNRLLARLQFFPQVASKEERDTGAPFYAFFRDSAYPGEWYITEAVTEGVREA